MSIGSCEASFVAGFAAHFVWDILLVALGALAATFGWKFKFRRHCNTHHNHGSPQ